MKLNHAERAHNAYGYLREACEADHGEGAFVDYWLCALGVRVRVWRAGGCTLERVVSWGELESCEVNLLLLQRDLMLSSVLP